MNFSIDLIFLFRFQFGLQLRYFPFMREDWVIRKLQEIVQKLAPIFHAQHLLARCLVLRQIQIGRHNQVQLFDVLFVHFPNTDFFGHSTGWMSDTYLFQLGRTDDALGRLFAALPADTVIIVSADHGGHDLGHGANIPVDMTIPWIIAGPGVREGYALTQPVTTTDTAVTAAYVLGLEFPSAVSGQVVTEAFRAAP